jgi:hypothetical protein
LNQRRSAEKRKYIVVEGEELLLLEDVRIQLKLLHENLKSLGSELGGFVRPGGEAPCRHYGRRKDTSSNKEFTEIKKLRFQNEHRDKVPSGL